MTVRKVYTCGICGVERKEANHWFVAAEEQGLIEMRTWERAQKDKKLDAEKTDHLCGQVCAHKFLDRFMTRPERRKEDGKIEAL